MSAGKTTHLQCYIQSKHVWKEVHQLSLTNDKLGTTTYPSMLVNRITSHESYVRSFGFSSDRPITKIPHLAASMPRLLSTSWMLFDVHPVPLTPENAQSIPDTTYLYIIIKFNFGMSRNK